MIIGITGSTGFIGRAFTREAGRRGWDVRPLPRRADAALVDGCDAIVHLAGESVDGRWTPQKKAEIERSRVEGTRELVEAIGAAPRKPRVLVSASAVGYYGDRADEPLFESSEPGSDFLAGVCRKWEREAEQAERHGVRAVMLRTGIVLGEGGALTKMMAPFQIGAGGPLGSGRQFVPWIHLEDVAALYAHAIENEALRGPVNAVTPDYATSSRFAQAIGAALRRPALLPAPGFALKAVVGEFADTLLASQLVLPVRAREAGFSWRYPRLESALQSIVDPSRATQLLRTFESQQRIDARLPEVFEFFSDAKNLELITPPSLHFAMTGDGPALHEGSVIDYALTLRGTRFAWRTLISRWDPPYTFTDVQMHGPYALWEHVHTFEARGPESVLMHDRVTYALPFMPLGQLADGFVRREVAHIFAYRADRIARLFSQHPETAAADASKSAF